MAHLPLTVTIITLNEEKNIARAIESVRWADEVLVVDSGSTDGTRDVAARHGARVIQNSWTGFGQQKNFAQSQAKNDWILNIDGDEEVTVELREEIFRKLDVSIPSENRPSAFSIPRRTHYLGRWIMHGGWYPNYLVRCADRRTARWTEPSIHEEWVSTGRLEYCAAPLNHFPFDSISDQVSTNIRYARLGSLSLQNKGQLPSFLMLVFKPLGKFFETYIFKKGFMDGLPGFLISVNAAHSMFLKYAFLFEKELHAHSDRR